MLTHEIAEIMENDGSVFEIASKAKYNMALTSEQKEVAEVIDKWAKQIGERGSDPEHELSAFILKTVTPVIYDTPDALIDTIFERGAIGEFDDTYGLVNPKNTLQAHDATKGGSVPKSYIDYTEIKPVWKSKQVETEISYTQLRKNGFKTVANLATFAEEALKNCMFHDAIAYLDTLITSTTEGQYFTATGSLTQEAIDEITLYLLEHGVNPFVLGRTKYAQQIARMTNYHQYMSEEMKNNFNRYGLVDFTDGVRVAHIPSVVEANGQPVLPDGKLFGIADKIGTLDMRGSLRMYETFDNTAEKVDIKLTGFEYGFMIEKPENVCKLAIN